MPQSNLTGGFGSSSLKESSRPSKLAKTSKRSSASTVASDKNEIETENLSSGDRNSMNSQMTIQTSATEVKARESSATMVRESLTDSVE